MVNAMKRIRGRILLAIHQSAIKRHRQSLKRRAVNKEARSRLRTLIKKARQAIEKKDAEQISSGVRGVSSAWEKAVRKEIVKKNPASRWLARLARSESRPA